MLCALMYHLSNHGLYWFAQAVRDRSTLLEGAGMGSGINRQEWEAAAESYAGGKAGVVEPDDLCCPLLPEDLHGLRILDAGCGAGQVARFLAGRGGSVVGIDISESLITMARADEEVHPLGITYVVHDLLEELPFGEGAFDIAIAAMAFMDVEDPVAAVRNVGRVVRFGGLLVFSFLHPCFYRPRFTADGTGVDLEHYFDRRRIEGRYIEAGDGGRIGYRQFHRTLGDYINTLVDVDFCVQRFLEPGDTRLAISCRKIKAER